MIYCIDCRVHIVSETDYCPLCGKSTTDDQNDNLSKDYPEYVPFIKRNNKLAGLLFGTAILLIVISVIVNIITWNGNLWSVVFSAYVLYLWLMGLVTFKTRVHLGMKLTGHAVAVSLLLLIMNAFMDNTETFNQVSWSVAYGMPIVFISFLALIGIHMIVRKQNLKEYLFYLLSLCVIGSIPFIIVICFIIKPILFCLISAAVCYLTIIGLAVFRKNIILEEIKKTFHI